MTRSMLLIVILSTVMVLTGCGGEKVSWRPGVISCGNKSVAVDEYSKDYAKKTLPDEVGEMKFYLTNNITDSPNNKLALPEEQMEKYRGCRYYTYALDSDVGLYMKKGKKFLEGYMTVFPQKTFTLEQSLNELYTTMGSLMFYENIKTISLSEKVTLKADVWDWKLRTNEVVIPNVLRVKADDGSVTVTDSVTIGKTNLGMKSSGSYDFYIYDGLIIQVAKGTDLSSVLTIK